MMVMRKIISNIKRISGILNGWKKSLKIYINFKRVKKIEII